MAAAGNWLATNNFTMGYRVTFPSFPTGSPAVNLRYMLNGPENGLSISIKSGNMQIKWPGAATSAFYTFSPSTAPLSFCLLYSWTRASQTSTVSIGKLEADGSVTPLSDDTGKSVLNFAGGLPGYSTSWEIADFTLFLRSASVTVDEIVLSGDVMTLQTAFGTAPSPPAPTGGGTVTTQTVTQPRKFIDFTSSELNLGDASTTPPTRWCQIVTPASSVLQLAGASATDSCRLTGLAAPTASSDAVNLDFLRTEISRNMNGLSLKKPVNVALESHMASDFWLTGIDGITNITAGFRVLLTNQNDRRWNGIWEIANNASGQPRLMQRPADFATGTAQAGSFVSVLAGTQKGRSYLCISDVASSIVDTHPLTFAESELGDSRIGTLTIQNSTLTSATKTISCADNDLQTTGALSASRTTLGSLVLTPATVTDSSGQVTFSNTSISTNRNVNVGSITLSGNSLTETSKNLQMSDTSLTTSATVNAGRFASYSDARLKTNIELLKVPNVDAIQPVRFTWCSGSKSQDLGFVAQDVQAWCPEAVATDGQGFLTVSYDKLVAPLAALSKDTVNRVDDLEDLTQGPILTYLRWVSAALRAVQSTWGEGAPELPPEPPLPSPEPPLPSPEDPEV